MTVRLLDVCFYFVKSFLHCDNVFPWIDDPVMLNVQMGWEILFGYTFVINKTFHFILALKIFTQYIVYCKSFSSFKLCLQKCDMECLYSS
jgi:hypothetical protein